MRRMNFFSVGRFLPAVATVNAVGLFQNTRFHFAEARDYRNELAEFAQLPWQRWKNNGLDPVMFSQKIPDREFYRGDGVLLMKLLKESCLMVIQNTDFNMEQAVDKATVDGYAYKVLDVLGNDVGFGYIAWRGPDEDELEYVVSMGNKILDKFAAEKKEGPAVDMVKAISELYGYVLTMKLKDSAPVAEKPRF